jgi:NAD(P) transhydrogenase subunit alpha
MAPGSVIVDLAVERGGNVEGAKAGQVVKSGPVSIVGYENMAGRIAATASLLFAKNLLTFLESMIDGENKKIALNIEDELAKATLLTHGGKVVHALFAGADGKTQNSSTAKKATTKKTSAKKTETKVAAKPAEGDRK